jgi:carbon monoxide dehydrogenase subunit G
MEHEAVVPLPAAALRRILREPATIARCLPGFAADAGAPADTVAGRLKLRIGNSSITYRGELRLSAEPDGTLVAHLDGQQSVGEGAVTGVLRAEALPQGEHESLLRVRSEFLGKGRVAELDQEAVRSAGRRLLDRFAAALADDPHGLIGEQAGEPPAESLEADDVEGPAEPLREADEADGLPVGPVLPSEVDGIGEEVEEMWPDAAPQRRALLGPSAEEVDHAPPRGRYAPALPARSARSRAAARWTGAGRRLGEPPSARGPAADRRRAAWAAAGVALAATAALALRRLRR